MERVGYDSDQNYIQVIWRGKTYGALEFIKVVRQNEIIAKSQADMLKRSFELRDKQKL